MHDESSGRSADAETVALDAADAMARVARHMERCLADQDLTLPQLRMLVYVAELNSHGQAPAASEIARQAQIRPPSLTALVSGLVNRGLVERRSDPSDRRRVLLHVTADGQAALEAGRRACRDRLLDVAAHAPDPAAAVDDLARWIPLLNAWRDEHRL